MTEQKNRKREEWDYGIKSIAFLIESIWNGFHHLLFIKWSNESQDQRWLNRNAFCRLFPVRLFHTKGSHLRPFLLLILSRTDNLVVFVERERTKTNIYRRRVTSELNPKCHLYFIVQRKSNVSLFQCRAKSQFPTVINLLIINDTVMRFVFHEKHHLKNKGFLCYQQQEFSHVFPFVFINNIKLRLQ